MAEDTHKHFVGKVAQKALIGRDGKVLLTRAPADKKWDLPGGRIHIGETPAEALRREILEELGVKVEITQPVFVGMTRTDSTGEERYFAAFAAALTDPGKPFVLQEDEVAETCWVNADELETTPIFDVCKEAVRTYFNKQR